LLARRRRLLLVTCVAQSLGASLPRQRLGALFPRPFGVFIVFDFRQHVAMLFGFVKVTQNLDVTFRVNSPEFFETLLKEVLIVRNDDDGALELINGVG
jgi:hypothetical protein